MTEPLAAHVRPIEEYATRHPQLAARAAVSGLLERAVAEAGSGIVLDAGCGEGATVGALAGGASSEAIIGCDLSTLRCAVARERGAAVTVADCQHLPVGAATVSLVISRHVIEHVEDDGALLDEFRRALRPGGLLYLETPLRLRCAWYPYRNADGRFVLDPTHVREYRTGDEVVQLAERAGFTVLGVDTRPIRYRVRHLVHRLLRPRRRAADDDTDRGWAVRVPRYREIQLLAAVR